MHVTRRFAAAFARARGGAALMEFALVLPVLLLLGLGGLETANYVHTVFRLSQIAEEVADNAGRVRQALDETDVNELMIGAKLMGSSINFATNGRIILSDLEQRTTTLIPGTYYQWIRWQRCAGALAKTSSYGGPINLLGLPVTNLSDNTNTDHGAVELMSTLTGMGPAGAQIAASGGTAVMVVELWYTYQPLVSLYSWGPRTMHVVQAFDIRQRTDFSVYNANSLSGTQRSDCTLNNSSVPTS